MRTRALLVLFVMLFSGCRLGCGVETRVATVVGSDTTSVTLPPLPPATASLQYVALHGCPGEDGGLVNTSDTLGVTVTEVLDTLGSKRYLGLLGPGEKVRFQVLEGDVFLIHEGNGVGKRIGVLFAGC